MLLANAMMLATSSVVSEGSAVGTGLGVAVGMGVGKGVAVGTKSRGRAAAMPAELSGSSISGESPDLVSSTTASTAPTRTIAPAAPAMTSLSRLLRRVSTGLGRCPARYLGPRGYARGFIPPPVSVHYRPLALSRVTPDSPFDLPTRHSRERRHLNNLGMTGVLPSSFSPFQLRDST